MTWALVKEPICRNYILEMQVFTFVLTVITQFFTVKIFILAL